jgi:hypothetical protein
MALTYGAVSVVHRDQIIKSGRTHSDFKWVTVELAWVVLLVMAIAISVALASKRDLRCFQHVREGADSQGVVAKAGSP